uniref:Uncharacterized protein n=1 Tax=Acrobeloides nanus TaxID=290746 RepID=A0A914C8U2_9BILA
VELHNKALARDSCGALMAFGRNMGFWIKSKCQEDLSTLPVIFTMRNNPCHMMIASLYTDQIFEIDKDGNLVNLLS